MPFLCSVPLTAPEYFFSFLNFFLTEKYDLIGRLLRKDEKAREYSDTEEEQSVHDKKD